MKMKISFNIVEREFEERNCIIEKMNSTYTSSFYIGYLWTMKQSSSALTTIE